MLFFMNVQKKTKDARIELQLESGLKLAAKEAAGLRGISVNELIRQAIRREIGKKRAAEAAP